MTVSTRMHAPVPGLEATSALFARACGLGREVAVREVVREIREIGLSSHRERAVLCRCVPGVGRVDREELRDATSH